MPLKHTVQEVVLKNGAKGLFILVPDATSVHYDVQFRAGNNYALRPDISQVAHTLEHMAFGANQGYPTIEAFSQEFTKNGAYSNAFTGSTELTYVADCAIMEWDRIMELERLSITKPLRSQALLDAEKGNVREELTGYLNDDWRTLWQHIHRSLGLKRWFDADELRTLDNITLDDIEEHYTRTHTTNNMRFILAGDLAPHMPALIDQFEQWELPAGEHLPLIREEAHAPGLVHIKRAQVQNLTFSVAFYINRELTRKELRAMNALNHMLTGTMHSKIWGTARTRGICYGMWSWISSQPTGVTELGFGGEVSFDNAHELFQLIIQQLTVVRTQGVSEDDLAQTKRFRLGTAQMEVETVKSLVSWYDDVYYDTGKIDYVDAMPALINGTTVEEIQGLLKEFLASGIWVFGGIGNIEKDALQKHYDLFAKDLIEG